MPHVAKGNTIYTGVPRSVVFYCLCALCFCIHDLMCSRLTFISFTVMKYCIHG